MKVVAIEGLDGAGKTSLCAAISSLTWGRSKVRVIASPAASVAGLCFAWRGIKPEGSSLAFLLGTKLLFDDVAREADVVVIDRYLLSTIVHHYDSVRGREYEYTRFLEAMDYVPADLTVFLKCEIEECERRIHMREADRPLVVDLHTQQLRYDFLKGDPSFGRWAGAKWVEVGNGAGTNFADTFSRVKSLIGDLI